MRWLLVFVTIYEEQKIFNVTPDLTTIAKGIANGFPVAAVCGKKKSWNFKPTGDVDYGGTFDGNPISLAAALATIKELEKNEVHKYLFKPGEEVRDQLNNIVTELNL
ncbi:MAG: aminotransferase class III-fold pyridoxal phosphate-dependent enzyme [Candidatus Bathyarchaeia archaeon]